VYLEFKQIQSISGLSRFVDVEVGSITVGGEQIIDYRGASHQALILIHVISGVLNFSLTIV
jgi:hypothetical protein